MVKIALVHATLARYLEAAGMEDDAGKLEIVLATTKPEELRAARDRISPEALVLDLDLLGADAESAIDAFERDFAPELILVVYSFAKWEVLERLRKAGRTLMRAPVSVRALRTSMVSLIVRQITQAGATRNVSTAIDVKAAPARRRFSDMQLAGLQMVRSSIDCECPNQVADLVIALSNFEEYSHQCRSRNEQDARVHAMLARMTGHARAVMEEALDQVCKAEGIDPDSPAPPERERAGA